jgi:hypothetical protein
MTCAFRCSAAVVLWLMSGCSSAPQPEAPVPPVAAPASAALASEAPTPARAVRGDGSGQADGSGRRGAGDGSGGGQQRFRQAGIWLDGVLLAAVRFGELPPGLKPVYIERTSSEGERFDLRRYTIADYLQALGVDVAQVREVHFQGGRGRIGVMPGDELRRKRAEVTFSFTQSDRGKPRLHWPREVDVNDKIDMLNDLTVYVSKPPPTWNAEKWQLEIGGQAVQGIPYASDSSGGGGVRVYVDGRIVRTLRPRSMGPGTGDPPKWALAAELAGAGVVLDTVRAVDLVDRDQRTARLSREAARTAQFELGDGDRGRLLVHPGGHAAEAVLVYVRAEPIEASPP